MYIREEIQPRYIILLSQNPPEVERAEDSPFDSFSLAMQAQKKIPDAELKFYIHVQNVTTVHLYSNAFNEQLEKAKEPRYLDAF